MVAVGVEDDVGLGVLVVFTGDGACEVAAALVVLVAVELFVAVATVLFVAVATVVFVGVVDLVEVAADIDAVALVVTALVLGAVALVAGALDFVVAEGSDVAVVAVVPLVDGALLAAVTPARAVATAAVDVELSADAVLASLIPPPQALRAAANRTSPTGARALQGRRRRRAVTPFLVTLGTGSDVDMDMSPPPGRPSTPWSPSAPATLRAHRSGRMRAVCSNRVDRERSSPQPERGNELQHGHDHPPHRPT